MKINKNIIAKDLDSPLQLIEIEIEDAYITGEVLVGSGSYVKGKVYKMPYINFVLTSESDVIKNKIVSSISSILTVEVLKENPKSFTGKVLYSPGYYKYGEIIEWDYKSFNFDKDNSNIPKHYNNDNGTLYKVAEERGWNSYLFDIVKRLEQAEKKGEFITDLEKSKVVIDLWLKESEQC